ncbi:MAG: ankyrin repeat domain-containing protein [Verrucomicrobiota bacterium]
MHAGTFKLLGILPWLALPLATSCRKPADAAKSELEEAGYKMTTADWFRAASGNQTEVMKKFTAGGFDVKTRDEKGATALHAAAAGGAEQAADFLLDHGLDVDETGPNQRTPLMAAVQAGQPAMAAWLIAQGADPAKKDSDGFSALMLAVKYDKPGALAEICPHDRENLDAALLLASITGSSGCIDVLTSYGASVYARMDDGRTPLMLAAENGQQDAANMLLELGASRFSTDESGRTAADFAITAGHEEIAEIINRPSAASAIALASEAEAGGPMSIALAKQTLAEKNPENEARPPEPIAAPLSLAGTLVGKSVAPAKITAGISPSTQGSTNSENSSADAAAPPLVMRAYRERELPIRLTTVNAGNATFQLTSPSPRTVTVATGGTIPGTTLQVIRARRRMEQSKLNPDATEEISVVEILDPSIGARREWLAGRPATAHDPVALVEDSTSGKLYTAQAGQSFRSEDGVEFIVTGVRPNQIVIENASTGATQTLSLRGTRG